MWDLALRRRPVRPGRLSPKAMSVCLVTSRPCQPFLSSSARGVVHLGFADLWNLQGGSTGPVTSCLAAASDMLQGEQSNSRVPGEREEREERHNGGGAQRRAAEVQREQSHH